MICDTLDQLHLYKGFHKNLDTAIAFLAAHPLDTLPLGRTEVDGDEVFINVMDADLKPHTGSHAEYHRLYADLQIDLTGGEGWGYETVPGTEVEPYQLDIGKKDSEDAVFGALGEGRFVLFFPGELHRPAWKCPTAIVSAKLLSRSRWRISIMDKEKLFAQIKGGLIVSCQALEHEPLYTKEGGVMPLMAKAAAMSGAVGIRANTVRDITQIKEVVDLPVIGIIKKDYPGTPMYITVTMKEVDELVACGVDILAVQGTGALRPDGSTSAEFIRAIKAKYPDQLVMADCDNFENAMACAEAGADFVGTTMRGYTPETQGIDDIDFDFVHKLATECPAKVIAEGHIHYPEQAVKALEAGAFALVVAVPSPALPRSRPASPVPSTP